MNSAISLRERRTAETSAALRAEARRLTSERGFGGFTIEELCSEVGVSRRTFFNYYASKENAVLGIPVGKDDSDLEDAFAAGVGELFDDLAALHLGRWARRSMTKAEAEELGRVFGREPRLFTHFIGLVAESERDDIALARRRADIDDDLDAEAAVQVFNALTRPSVFEYFATEGADYPTILRRRLSAVRDLFSR